MGLFDGRHSRSLTAVRASTRPVTVLALRMEKNLQRDGTGTRSTGAVEPSQRARRAALSLADAASPAHLLPINLFTFILNVICILCMCMPTNFDI
jgi:hypothetical protein